MNKKKKTALIIDVLNNFFPNPEVPLKHFSPYTLLVAVLLSAQCTDKKVNKVTEKLFKKASTPYEMSLLSIEQIEKIIKPCGLYHKKAKAISDLSKLLIEKYKGKVPDTLKKLKDLPGVGHKTASVVLSLAFKKDAFPVDTHIFRLAKRWGLSMGKSPKEIERDLKKLFPKKSWAKIHLQIISFGKTFCKAINHKKEKCPICRILN